VLTVILILYVLPLVPPATWHWTALLAATVSLLIVRDPLLSWAPDIVRSVVVTSTMVGVPVRLSPTSSLAV